MTPDGDAAPSRYDSASLRKINLNHKTNTILVLLELKDFINREPRRACSAPYRPSNISLLWLFRHQRSKTCKCC